jgi:hypothetical protein
MADTVSEPHEDTYASAPLIHNRADDPVVLDGLERDRTRVLPYAMTLVFGLLAGFAADEFIHNSRPAPQVSSAPPAVSRTEAPVAGSPATPDKAGQYSEQKVTPPAPPAATPRATATPPPVPDEHPTRAPLRAQPIVKRGTLVVKSTPSRASVTVNGTWRGRTPLTLDDLAFGKYVVRVVQPGFRTAREEFTLNARDAAHTVNTRLERESTGAVASSGGAPASRRTDVSPPVSFTGSLYVDSRPRGATVFVDGRSIGQTPVMLPNVPAGAHVVRIELTGKKPWTSSTRVASGETARVTGSLEDRP